MAGQTGFKYLAQSHLFSFLCFALISLLPARGYAVIPSAYSIDMAAGWTNNVDRQQSGQGSGVIITTINGLWSFEPERLIPGEVKGTISNVQYMEGGSSQQLGLDAGLWLWKSPAAELILYGGWQYFQSSRLPADDFHSPAATLLVLTRRPPFTFHLAQDLQWSYFKRSVDIGGAGTEKKQERPPAPHHQQGQLLQSKKRHEDNSRSRFGVDVQVTPHVNLSSDINYAENRASIAPERWYARGASLGAQWWPQQFWQGQIWWQQHRTYYRETVNKRHDRTDTLILRIDYQPGDWQFYTQWQWQRNKSSLPVEDYRGQEIICGVIYHF